jgi:DNA-binding beta-propeller fold protein YncE
MKAALTAAAMGVVMSPIDVIFDGANVWVAESNFANRLRKLNPDGSIAQTVAVGTQPAYMAYDGANIWVPNFAGNSITVVQASTGAIVATIASTAATRLSTPLQGAFDGERVLVTNPGNDSVTLFRAADFELDRQRPACRGLDAVRRLQ